MVRANTLLLLLGLAACSTPKGDDRRDALDRIAEDYVRLVLAVGRHDPMYVDAFHGPASWKSESEAGIPVPLPLLLERSRELLKGVKAASGPADRRRSLEVQLTAVEGHLRRLSGSTMSLSDECRVLYDVEAPRHPTSEFEAAHAALEAVVPGDGPLAERIEAVRAAARVPPARLAATLDAALAESRRACLPLVRLPAGERFESALVSGKPWSAYNWYLGGFTSRIELNTDLPIELDRLFGTMCHEGYPGHHVYNVLLEDRLVRGKGWVEFSIYPLYSPQSFLAEGTANVGEDILFSDDERRRILAEVLAPVAGVAPDAVLLHDRIASAMEPLRHVSGEAARMLLDDGRPEDEVVAFLMRWGLASEEKARKSVAFARSYRSYVFNYSLGEEVVGAAIGDGPDRRERFFDLLVRPVVPSELQRNVTGR